VQGSARAPNLKSVFSIFVEKLIRVIRAIRVRYISFRGFRDFCVQNLVISKFLPTFAPAKPITTMANDRKIPFKITVVWALATP
jgi:hypothetical protein